MIGFSNHGLHGFPPNETMRHSLNEMHNLRMQYTRKSAQIREIRGKKVPPKDAMPKKIRGKKKAAPNKRSGYYSFLLEHACPPYEEEAGMITYRVLPLLSQQHQFSRRRTEEYPSPGWHQKYRYSPLL